MFPETSLPALKFRPRVAALSTRCDPGELVKILNSLFARFEPGLYCTVMYCTVLYCAVLDCTVL